MAKSRKLSKNRILLELIENGIDAEMRKQQRFFALDERFRNERDAEAANRLGDELGSRPAFTNSVPDSLAGLYPKRRPHSLSRKPLLTAAQ
jgi:hypothetical protein